MEQEVGNIMDKKMHNDLMNAARRAATANLIAANKDQFEALLKVEQDARGVSPKRARSLTAAERAARDAEKQAVREAKRQARLAAEAEKIAARLAEIEKSLAA